MTVLTIGNPCYTFHTLSFGKWAKQNNAEFLDGFDGCLLDNSIYACKRGYAAVYERYGTPNCSYYEIQFVPYKAEQEVKALWHAWDAAYDAYCAEYDNDEE